MGTGFRTGLIESAYDAPPGGQMWQWTLVFFVGGCAQPMAVRDDAAQAPSGPTLPVKTQTQTQTQSLPTPTGGEADCPEGVTCVDTLPFVDANTTAGAAAVLDSYGCAAEIDESGPEQVYRVTLHDEGLLVVSLDGLAIGVDVDVHLLEEADPASCIDRGHWDAAALLPAGTYWVVVDSWVDGAGLSHEGDYTLTMSQIRSDDYTADGLYSDALEAALFAFDTAWAAGETDRLEFTVLDFSVPSDEQRMFVLDLRSGSLLFSELASHGIGSQDPDDLTVASTFSDVSGSNASSLGLVRAAETYFGSNGYSLRLDGLEPGFNGNMRSRAIVIHPADYATEAFVDATGYLGRSQGCPAVDPAVSEALIDTISEGSLLFAYAPDPVWMGASAYLQGF